MGDHRQVVLARIDDRLIHGQVVIKWLRAVSCDELVICDDGVRGDAFLAQVLRLATPRGMVLQILSVSECVEYLTTAGPEGARPIRVFLLVKTPGTALELVRQGISIPKLNVGGIASGPGSRRLHKSVSATPKQEAQLVEIQSMGVPVLFQSVPEPEESPVSLDALTSRHMLIANSGR